MRQALDFAALGRQKVPRPNPRFPFVSRSSSFLPRLAAFTVLLAPLPALAQGTPRSIIECERLKNDLAYNQCLAMFGPAAKNVAGGYASADPAAVPAFAAPLAQGEDVAEPAPSGRRGHYRGRRGRQSAVFALGGETRSYRRRRRY